jgi:hypothetical protein
VKTRSSPSQRHLWARYTEMHAQGQDAFSACACASFPRMEITHSESCGLRLCARDCVRLVLLRLASLGRLRRRLIRRRRGAVGEQQRQVPCPLLLRRRWRGLLEVGDEGEREQGKESNDGRCVVSL